MLVDIYRAAVATVGGDGYSEYVIYEYTQDEAVLKHYTKYGEEDEVYKSCIIPISEVDKINVLIKNNEFKNWNNIENPVSLDGAKLVLKFYDGEDFYSVSSENMPPDGKEKFALAESAAARLMKG